MNRNDMVHVPSMMHAELCRGRLDVTALRAAMRPELLFGFAERRNPKRAFLFVSRVLGRHIPVRPSVMTNSFDTLAGKIPVDLPGPILMIGMAETAVGLGAGIHRSLSRGRDDVLYWVSTRHPLGTDVLVRFEEEHSHASAHLLHRPINPTVRDMMLRARSVVLVDDEVSTGKTFVNLYRALLDAELASIERVVTCVLTDWSDGALRKAIGHSVQQISLLEGSYRFTEDASAPLPEMPEVGTVAPGHWPLTAGRDWGRLGVLGVEDAFGAHIRARDGERILVVGTSEFVWRPFLLAERLEQEGADVHFSSTSRSPIALGHAIEHALSFSDNYGLGIPNFLYNVKPGQFDRVLLCTETPAESISRHLIDTLNAEIVTDEL
jgi:hypothetical protein